MGLLFLSPANIRGKGLALLCQGWWWGFTTLSLTSQIRLAPWEMFSEQTVPLQCSSHVGQSVPPLPVACSCLPSTQLRAWSVLLSEETLFTCG